MNIQSRARGAQGRQRANAVAQQAEAEKKFRSPRGGLNRSSNRFQYPHAGESPRHGFTPSNRRLHAQATSSGRNLSGPFSPNGPQLRGEGGQLQRRNSGGFDKEHH